MVKLKMRAIYKTILSFIGFLILLIAALGIMYLFYDKVKEIGSDIEVTGNLSINYIDGKNFYVDDKELIKFSVSNSGNIPINYNVGFAQVRGDGNYRLLYEESIITEGTLKSIDEIITDVISVEAGETREYTLEINNSGTTPLKGILNIRVKEGSVITFADVILKNVAPSDNALTKVGHDIATENEGLIKSSDDVGVSYYFRGNVTNNYVSFGGMMWRIVRINGDGTVRLVLDGTTETIATYYNTSSASFRYEDSNMNIFLKNWLQDNLRENINYIANTKFCSDIGYDEGYTYSSYTRIMTNKIPTLNCLGYSLSNNIGLLTIDEIILAGANTTEFNKVFYLYNADITESWYTMTGAKGSDSYINLFMVDINGTPRTDINGNLYRNVRPVINLIKNIEMEGTGSKEDPYRMAE